MGGKHPKARRDDNFPNPKLQPISGRQRRSRTYPTWWWLSWWLSRRCWGPHYLPIQGCCRLQMEPQACCSRVSKHLGRAHQNCEARLKLDSHRTTHSCDELARPFQALHKDLMVRVVEIWIFGFSYTPSLLEVPSLPRDLPTASTHLTFAHDNAIRLRSPAQEEESGGHQKSGCLSEQPWESMEEMKMRVMLHLASASIAQ